MAPSNGAARRVVSVFVGEQELLRDLLDVRSAAARQKFLSAAAERAGADPEALVHDWDTRLCALADQADEAAAAAAGAAAAEKNEDALQGRALALADPEPWSEPVCGAALLDELAALFARHVVLPFGAADALALWAALSYLTDRADTLPRLAVLSPERRCGKTRLLELLARLVRRPVPAANISAAALFRAVEAWQPTVLIDEADTFLAAREEILGLLNSGHTRGTAFVVRCVPDPEAGDYVARIFSTWALVAIAAIGTLPPPLLDRPAQ